MSYGSINSGSTSELTERQIKDVLSLAHPVGSLYMSDDATSPAELFGGTWEQIKDKFILAAGDTYAVRADGGNAIHSHNYGVQSPYYYGAIVGENGEAIKIANYSPDGSVSMAFGHSGAGLATVGVNTQLAASYVNTACTLFTSTAKVSYESSLPPYTTKYIWQRLQN